MTFYDFSRTNIDRCQRWRYIDSWTLSDWAVAMVGEAGEACNAIKKKNRLRDGIANISSDPDRQISTHNQAIDKIAEEIADTVIYCDLIMAKLGRNLEHEIQKKFNQVSVEYGFPERL